MAALITTTHMPRFHSVSTGTLADLAGELEMRRFAVETELADVMTALKGRGVTIARGNKWHLSLTKNVHKVIDDVKLRAFVGANGLDSFKRNVVETRPSLQLINSVV
jgi:hypothetical protein